jgi:hypothetical protein
VPDSGTNGTLCALLRSIEYREASPDAEIPNSRYAPGLEQVINSWPVHEGRTGVIVEVLLSQSGISLITARVYRVVTELSATEERQVRWPR